MTDDDNKTRTVTKPQARVVAPPADNEATIINPHPRTAFAPMPPAPAPAHPDGGNNLPVGTMLAEFEITEVLGEGGFGIVYLARDHSLERRVALKEYMPSALAARSGITQVSVKSERHRETFEAGLKSFVNEARLLAQFDHPSLVKVYRFWEANGTAYMVMPFYEGITLKQQLKDMGAAPNEAWLRELLDPLTEALQVIHTEQCYHRDIAPDNVILLKGSNRPLLLDFGAARRVIGDMTQALTVILKPGYAPVEQYAEVPGMKQGPWTDVYALAAVVYYAIMGKTPPTSVGRLMNDNYQPLATAAAGRYSERFLKAIDAALVVKPEERTQTIGDLREALGLTGSSVPAGRSSSSPSMPKAKAPPARSTGTSAGASEPRSKTPLILGGAVLGIALLGGGLYAMLAPSKKPAPAETAANSAPTNATAPAPAPTAAPAPATAVPPPPAVAEVPTSLDPVREFQRVVQAQTPGFVVDGASLKPTLKIGKDQLGLTISSARDGYLYVLLAGTDGAFVQLYPNAKARNNKIRATQIVKLPDPSWPMEASGPPGTDHFLAIVSKFPRDFSATGVHPDGEFPKDRGVEVLRAHTGRGSPYAGRAVCDASPCDDEYGAATFTAQEVQ